jgi:hypothetical protein
MMHGLGDTADGWIDVAESLAMQLPHVRFILPTASEKAVTLNNGMMMPSCTFYSRPMGNVRIGANKLKMNRV